ncbi:MAG: nicotinate-nucleotide adenylyltransferase [Prevotellaceae bacterium]|jgi:nicotinate-nucleotide adenylyltransferase|nr:nicotinate-nucleotide adenylyltransferase [Prevotellaceae bacterium]
MISDFNTYKKIAFFSGSFDPPHNGHLTVANYLCENENFDEVWFTVTPHNPLKEKRALTPVATRIAMAQLAIEHNPKFRICDIECSLPQPSYTINTLTALQERHPQHTFTLIIGADNWANLSHWKDYRRILTEFDIMIYPRADYDAGTALRFPRVKLIPAPEVQISSTAVREAVKHGKDIRRLVPENIYTYIKQHNFYDENTCPATFS